MIQKWSLEHNTQRTRSGLHIQRFLNLSRFTFFCSLPSINWPPFSTSKFSLHISTQWVQLLLELFLIIADLISSPCSLSSSVPLCSSPMTDPMIFLHYITWTISCWHLELREAKHGWGLCQMETMHATWNVNIYDPDRVPGPGDTMAVKLADLVRSTIQQATILYNSSANRNHPFSCEFKY